MQRFYFPSHSFTQILTIHDDAFVHQVSRVLRSNISDEIALFSGDGNEYRYAITAITKREISLALQETTSNSADPRKRIRLCQALPNKYEKIEYILQKWIEIGVHEFVFFPSERSQKLLLSDRKIERFHEIAREALEQSGGNRMPSIVFLERSGIPFFEDPSIVLHTTSADSVSISAFATTFNEDVTCYIGPEGGWNDTEMWIFTEHDTKIIHLGDRIMRTETAGMVVGFYLLQA